MNPLKSSDGSLDGVTIITKGTAWTHFADTTRFSKPTLLMTRLSDVPEEQVSSDKQTHSLAQGVQGLAVPMQS